MGNWEREIGARYFHRTVYESTEMFAEVLKEESPGVEPSPFKIYTGVERHSLSGNLPLHLDGTPVEDGQPLLSALLYYTYGFSRRDEGPSAVWPLHRFVPSARCLFPTELYVWTPGVGGLAAGVYHYDNLHHQLELIRDGDLEAELSALTGADLGGANCVLLVSSLFWKNAFKYRGYSYRLCSQEAGMVVGNALQVGEALGLRGHVHYQFVDERAGALLGLGEDEEHVFAVVPMYPGPREVRRLQDARPGEVPEIAPAYHHEGVEQDLDQSFREIADNVRLRGVEEFATEHPGGCPGGEVLREEAGPPGVDLAAALRARNSGNVLFNPVAGKLSSGTFWEIVRPALRPYTCDLRERGTPLRLYAVAQNVDGLPTGVYRVCAEHGGLHVLATGDFSRPLQGAVAVPNLSLCGSNLVLYLAADFPAASAVFGNRAYRILSMEAGLAAQRICVASAAHGLAARIHNGYDAATVEKVLNMKETPLFQIAVAHNRPGVQYGLPIMF
jgi:SagB-type dehydrogenase family enzyme